MAEQGATLRRLRGVGAGADVSATSGPVGVDVLADNVCRSGKGTSVTVCARERGMRRTLGVGLLGEDLPGVGTEVVALGLEHVGGEDLGAVAVEEGEGRGERGGGDSPERGLGNDAAPS